MALRRAAARGTLARLAACQAAPILSALNRSSLPQEVSESGLAGLGLSKNGVYGSIRGFAAEPAEAPQQDASKGYIKSVDFMPDSASRTSSSPDTYSPLQSVLDASLVLISGSMPSSSKYFLHSQRNVFGTCRHVFTQAFQQHAKHYSRAHMFLWVNAVTRSSSYPVARACFPAPSRVNLIQKAQIFPIKAK